MRVPWAFLCALCLAPGGSGEYSLPKFICSPMPLEMEHGCQSASQPRHGAGGGSHWVGTLEEAKETILHLRETVVHQKETILDQRETVRELTAKLSRCEARSWGHESGEHSSEHGSGHHEENHSHDHRAGGHHEDNHSHEHRAGGGHHEDDHGHDHRVGGSHHEDDHGHDHRLHHEDDHGHEHRLHHEGHWVGGHHDGGELHGRENEYHHFGHREHLEPQAGHSGHEAYRKGAAAANTMEDPPRETLPGAHQMERLLESLKERLEHLQHNRNSSGFSSSLRDALQKKISILEHQIQEKFNATEPHWHKPDSHGSEKGHKVDKLSEDFRVGFPLRTNYMYVKVKRMLHHEVFAFSICLWLKSSTAPGVGTPFSYSVPGQANELVLIEWGNNPMELLINDKAATLPLAINDAKWHHICITWSTRDGVWESYQDGVRRGSGENLAPWHPIKPGGIFILGQEQDTLGGRFDATQAFIGELSDFNMWSRILTPGEVYKMATCASHAGGDLITWVESSMELHGGVAKLPFNSCH
ncbi:neuronal pentraxin-1 [Alligator mississippiensis]|uniref:Neuronal pentraxin-1-like n=1 Tax=Alligator mississippiensis TaxID=8496 RepID=A0A151P5W4_ALLMI|nr:neuronal pentraxin-1 [Alligator mississippiensis]KYO44403.1 neuronal pentraxin-1-like [Alligator mississippiensis]